MVFGLSYIDSKKQPHHLCLIVYYVPEDFEPKLQPHGNSKSDKPFYPTLPSTLQAISGSHAAGNKQILSDVSSSVGGVLSASDPCSLPRSEQQVADVKRRLKRSNSGGSDELAVVMQKAYLEDDGNQFIREMKILREPAIVVATERQINDLVRFCTNSSNFGIMTIDPTFCLGEFEVMVTTYRQLTLQSRRTADHPVFIGPVMIHYRKSFSTYLFFASTLVGMKPELSNLKSFGTDGEEALFDAFQQVFPNAVHLLCALHMKRNVKAKLQELSIGEHIQQMVMGDIFGKQVNSQLIEGLVDSCDEKQFEEGLEALSKKWEGYDMSNSYGVHRPLHAFGVWFKQYKGNLLKKKMLKPVRTKAGLGNQPLQFTTNASESINAVLKRKVGYKKSELPEFLDELRKVIDEQEHELERAVINKGKYRLGVQHRKLEILESHWFMKMSLTQRESHIKKVLSLQVGSKIVPPRARLSVALNDGDHSNKPSCSRQLFPQSQSSERMLSIDVSQFCESVLIPRSVLDAIWRKGNELLNDSNSICMVPGGNSKDRIVKSSSGPRPHIVTAKKKGQYTCDGECPNWKSLRVCSHTVAAAEDNNDLDAFIQWLKKAKKVPNMTELVTTSMPKGRGRKGCAPPRKRVKQVPVDTHKTLSEVLQEQTSSSQIVFDEDVHPGSSDIELQASGGSSISTEESFYASGGDVQSSIPACTSMEKYHHSQQGGSVELMHTASGASTRITVTGGTQESSHLPPLPPPLVHCPSALSPQPSSPFELAFIRGNISVCRGCRQRYPKPAFPPMDICVRHKEWQNFVDPCGDQQSRYGNVYYHCNIPCIQSRCPEFQPQMLDIPSMIAMQLLPVHTDYLIKQMPGKFNH